MTMTLISTITVGASPTYSINFSSIAQTFTDLYCVVSSRDTNAATNTNLNFRFNANTGSNYSQRRLYGNGSVSGSDNTSATTILTAQVPGSSATSNTFGSISLYIPNYTGATNKSCSIDVVTENNGTTAEQNIIAGLWSQTTAITEINILAGIQFVQGATASLYGILKGSGGATVS